VPETLTETKHAPTILETIRDTGLTEKKAPIGEQKGGVTVIIGAKDCEVSFGEVPSPPAIKVHEPKGLEKPENGARYP